MTSGAARAAAVSYLSRKLTSPMLLLDIDRSVLFGLERQALDLEHTGDVGTFVDGLKPIVAMLTGRDQDTGQIAVDSLSNTDVPPERRASSLRFAVEWMRRLQRGYRFLLTLDVVDGAFSAFLESARHEEKRTTGSDAVPLGAIGKRAKLPPDVVDRAAGRAYDAGLIYHSGIDETAHSILLEHEEVDAAIEALGPSTGTGEWATAAPVAQPRVDVGIITITEEEFTALLDVFADEPQRFQGPRSMRRYNLRNAQGADGEMYRIAICRAIEQGNGESQALARDMIDELSPSLLLVVGIAGGAPTNDFTLGDIILSLRVHDFTAHAVNSDATREYALGGGPMIRNVAAHVADLPSYRAELATWHASLPERPVVDVDNAMIQGPDAWVARVRASLAHHFGNGKKPSPKYTSGVIGSSDGVIKDPNVMSQWLSTARNLLAVEMETAGAYRAASAPEGCAVLAIRALSDIVGLKRDDEWKRYACRAAAAFTQAYLRTTPVPPTVLAARQATNASSSGAIFAEFYRSLASTVASERAAAFDGIDRVLSYGAPATAAILDRLERFALDPTSDPNDRARSIQIMRARIGVRPRTMCSLVTEYATNARSSIFPGPGNSGPAFALITDSLEAMDVLLEVFASNVEISERHVRDVLQAMSYHLREHARSVGEERAKDWKRFVGPHTAQFPREVASVVDLIDGDRFGH